MSGGRKSPAWVSKLTHHGQRSERAPSEEPEPDTRARRREQVRRAQRTHRDRKATYVKALELEVAKLRARDVAHEDESLKYQDIIRHLSDLLRQNNIPIPPGLSSVQAHSPVAMIEVLGHSPASQNIRAHMPVFDASAPHPYERPSTSLAPAAYSAMPENPLTSIPSSTSSTQHGTFSPTEPFSFVRQPTVPRPPHPHGLDATQVAVDFVLALEQPCLSHHVSSAGGDGDDGTGHQLMLQAPILSHGPSSTLSARGSGSRGIPEGSTWSVPAVELEKLLQFSEGLDLDGEITPVQAWQRLHRHERFSELTRENLDGLREALLSRIECYGFGAVVDEVWYNQCVDQVFEAKKAEGGGDESMVDVEEVEGEEEEEGKGKGRAVERNA